MKKFMKVCGITALIFIVVGLILAFAAGTTEGAAAIRDAVSEATNGKVQVNLNGIGDWGVHIAEGAEQWTDGVMDGIEDWEDTVNYDIEKAMVFDDGFELFSGEVKKEFAAPEIQELDVEVGGCSFTIEESGDDRFYVEAEGMKKFQTYVKGDCLFIKGTVKAVVGDKIDGNVVLKVPAGFNFEKLDMEIGAGVMELGELSAKKIDLEVGAGQIIADKAICEDLMVMVGMGEARMNDMQVAKFDAEVGMGNIYAKGNVSEKVIVECAMGNVELELAGKQEDYDYSIECGMGNVTVGGNTYSGLAKEKDISNGADRKMDVECAVGNIDIQFKD